jgi:hypothetical protein
MLRFQLAVQRKVFAHFSYLTTIVPKVQPIYKGGLVSAQSKRKASETRNWNQQEKILAFLQ